MDEVVFRVDRVVIKKVEALFYNKEYQGLSYLVFCHETKEANKIKYTLCV